MKNIFNNLYFSFLFIFLLLAISLVFWTTYPVTAQETDAIAVSVYDNDNHKSALVWYEDEFDADERTGTPQSLIVDGYNAIRDNRTVYVHAADADLDGSGYDSYIFTLSYYSKDNRNDTVDIFSRMLDTWTFNTNMIEDPGNFGSCSISNMVCHENADCGEGYTCVSGSCRNPSALSCWRDRDCPENWFCGSSKSEVTRNTVRLERLSYVRDIINDFYSREGTYPELAAGTYIPGRTLSTWPSWSETLSAEVGGGEFPLDPINVMGNCGEGGGFDPRTCWDEDARRLAGHGFKDDGVYDGGTETFVLGYTPKMVYAFVGNSTVLKCRFDSDECTGF